MWVKIQYLFRSLLNLWLMILMVIVAYMVLVALPQGYEVFLDISRNDTSRSVAWATGIAILSWAFMIWYCSRTLTTVWRWHYNQDQDFRSLNLREMNRDGWLIVAGNYFPAILGAFVLVFFWMATGNDRYQTQANYLIPIITSVIYLVVVIRSLIIIRKKRARGEHEPERQPDAYGHEEVPENWREFPDLNMTKLTKVVITFVAGLYVLVILIFIFPGVSIPFSQWIGPLAVLGFGLGFFTLMGAVIRYIDLKSKLPTSLGLVLLVFIFSQCNDNDGIQTTPAEVQSPIQEDNIRDYFENWIAKRHPADSTQVPEVILIAGQGGGSRASYWISSVMAKLDSANPDFFRHVFAISSVSGSSAGTGFYSAYKRYSFDQGLPTGKWNLPDMRKDLREISGSDYLSPNSAPLFASEALQQLLFFPMKWTDRAKYLEDAWSRGFTRATDQALLDGHFLSVYDADHRMPLQFYNTTIVERGMISVTAPFAPTTDTTLQNKIFLTDYAEKRIPLKTAMSLSARFPVLTSPGLIPIDSVNQLNFVDGGYYENTGLYTASLIYNELVKLREDTTRKLDFNVRLIYIRNSKSDYFNQTKAITNFKIGTIPLNALLKSWDTEGPQMHDIVQAQLRAKGDSLDLISLNYFNKPGEKDYPLSRYLAEFTKERMKQEVEQVSLQPFFK